MPLARRSADDDAYVTGRVLEERDDPCVLEEPGRCLDEKEVDVLLDGQACQVDAGREREKDGCTRFQTVREEPRAVRAECGSHRLELGGGRHGRHHHELAFRLADERCRKLEKAVERGLAEHGDEDRPQLFRSMAARASGLGQVESWILAKHRRLEVAQPRPGLDTELVDEGRSSAPIRVKSLDLAARAVQGEHQEPAWPLPQRVLRDERLDLGDRVGVLADLELCLEPTLARKDAKLVETRSDRRDEVLVAQVGQGGAAPEVESLREKPRGLVGAAVLECRAAVVRETLEDREIEAVLLDADDVPRATGLDRLLSEGLAEAGHVSLDEVLR